MEFEREPEKKKKTHKKVKMNDKRIERARARHELACLGMGIIFLVDFWYVTHKSQSQDIF